MQLLTATLLRPGASSSSVISTQPRERTAKHCQTQKRGWEVQPEDPPNTGCSLLRAEEFLTQNMAVGRVF